MKYPNRFIERFDYGFDVIKLRKDDITLWRAFLLKNQSYKSKIKPPNGKTFEFHGKFMRGRIELDGTIVLYSGARWDLATGAVDTPDIIRASAFHDFICEAVEAGALPVEYRRMGDDMFRDIAKEDGMPWWRRTYTHFAVVKYGEIKYRNRK